MNCVNKAVFLLVPSKPVGEVHGILPSYLNDRMFAALFEIGLMFLNAVCIAKKCIEVLDRTGNAGAESAGVKGSNRRDTALAGDDVLPRILDVVSNRGQ